MFQSQWHHFFLLGALAGAAVPAAACHGGAKPAETPSSGESTPSDGGTDAAPVAETPSPLAAVLLTDSSAVQKLYDAANSAPAATLKDDGIKGPGPLAAGLRSVAKKAAPGMQPQGPLGTGKLKEKDHLQMDVTLEPGKCYALIGYAPKMKDLDLYLLTPPGVLVGQDTTDDNKPVVGRAPEAMCPAAARAITYKVDIFADEGSGAVAVQLYSKDKGADAEGEKSDAAAPTATHKDKGKDKGKGDNNKDTRDK